jgi:hypothetical protein
MILPVALLLAAALATQADVPECSAAFAKSTCGSAITHMISEAENAADPALCPSAAYVGACHSRALEQSACQSALSKGDITSAVLSSLQSPLTVTLGTPPLETCAALAKMTAETEPPSPAPPSVVDSPPPPPSPLPSSPPPPHRSRGMTAFALSLTIVLVLLCALSVATIACSGGHAISARMRRIFGGGRREGLLDRRLLEEEGDVEESEDPWAIAHVPMNQQTSGNGEAMLMAGAAIRTAGNGGNSAEGDALNMSP